MTHIILASFLDSLARGRVLGVVMGHELVSNRKNLKQKMHLRPFAGFRFQKVPIYYSVYLTKISNALPSESPLGKNVPWWDIQPVKCRLNAGDERSWNSQSHCIRLVRLKFEQTNQDLAGGKKCRTPTLPML